MKMSYIMQRVVFMAMSACHTSSKPSRLLVDTKLLHRTRRLVPDSLGSAEMDTPQPFPDNDQNSHWARNRSKTPELDIPSQQWATWAEDRVNQIRHSNVDGSLNSDSSNWKRGSGWNSFDQHEDKLLATMVPIPLSMIVLFLAISWYRRNKSSQRRRRERLRRHHLVELNVIRRQLASQNSNTTSSHPDSGVGPSVSDHQGSEESLSLFNPPSYSEALDTNLYPLVTSPAHTEHLPAYSDITRESPQRESPQRSECGMSEDSPLTEHVRTFCVVDSPYTPSEIDLNLCDSDTNEVIINHNVLPGTIIPPRPPSYSEIFPNITISEL